MVVYWCLRVWFVLFGFGVCIDVCVGFDLIYCGLVVGFCLLLGMV